MAINALEYEICKQRHHEEFVPDLSDRLANQNYQMGNRSEWKTCRWCGAQYKDVQVSKQVERA